jgi:hypothetical protein
VNTDEDGFLRVVHEGRSCIWIPYTKDGVPVEGLGTYIAETTSADAEPGSIAIKFSVSSKAAPMIRDPSRSTSWILMRPKSVKKIAMAMLTRSRETAGG